MADLYFPTLGGKSVIDPRDLFAYTDRWGAPNDYIGRANSFSNPIGKEAGVGWFLMQRRDADAIADTPTSVSLSWKSKNTTLTVPSLVFVRATAMSLATESDNQAAMLVEVRDKRVLLAMSDSNSQYNVRKPNPHGTSTAEEYYTASLNGGSLWTWQQMLNDLWGDLPGTAGTSPSLPFTPSGSPENFRFIGMSTWDAIDEIMQKLSCAIAYDPINASFSCVQLGISQTELTTHNATLEQFQMVDYGPTEKDSAFMPENFIVYFRRMDEHYGAEKDTPDTGNWEMTPAHTVTVASGSADAVSGSKIGIWDDMQAQVNKSGGVINSSALNSRASEVATDYFRRLRTSSHGVVRKKYGGIFTGVLAGSEIDEVIWRDYGNGEGLVTEHITRRSGKQIKAGIDRRRASFSPLSFPVWPHVLQITEIDDGSSSDGASVSKNSDDLFPAKVVRSVDGAESQLEDCWLRALKSDDGSVVSSLLQGQNLFSRLSGYATSGGNKYPLYTAIQQATASGIIVVGTWNGSVTLSSTNPHTPSITEWRSWMTDSSRDCWIDSGVLNFKDWDDSASNDYGDWLIIVNARFSVDLAAGASDDFPTFYLQASASNCSFIGGSQDVTNPSTGVSLSKYFPDAYAVALKHQTSGATVAPSAEYTTIAFGGTLTVKLTHMLIAAIQIGNPDGPI